MNDKMAKALRRVARESGLAPVTSYLINRHTGVIVVDPRCERALYRAMKKHVQQPGETDGTE